MEAIKTHIHNTPHQLGLPVGQFILNQRDPTRTTSLRAAFVRGMNRRFRTLTRLITKAIVEEDVFGLRDTNALNVTILQTPGRRAFAFPRSADKVSAFMEWLNQQVNNHVLQVTQFRQVGQGVEAAWTNIYIQDSYRRGVTRARYELSRAGFDVPALSETGGIVASMGLPFHVDRLGLLFTRTFSELRGITAAMEQQIGRLLAQGIADGIGPATLARMLNYEIIGTGSTLGLPISYINPRTGSRVNYVMSSMRRATILARTEIIRAHAEATLQEYKNWGAEGVRVKAEWVTAGDDRVCAECAGLEGAIFTLATAQGMLPLHPNCRCAWIPLNTAGEVKPSSEFDWEDSDDMDKVVSQLESKYDIKMNKASLVPGSETIQRLNLMGRTIGNDILARTQFLETVGPKPLNLNWSRIAWAGEDKGTYGYYQLSRGYGVTPEMVFAPEARVRLTHTLTTGGTQTLGSDFATAVRHEYGHHVYYKTLNAQDRRVWNDFYESYKSGRKWGKNVSWYGASSTEEAFAESFSAYFSPLYETGVVHKSLPAEIIEILENLLGKRK